MESFVRSGTFILASLNPFINLLNEEHSDEGENEKFIPSLTVIQEEPEQISLGQFESFDYMIEKKSYLNNFTDSMHYTGLSLKASMYFLINAIIPDIFQCSGNIVIDNLYNQIKTNANNNIKEKTD